MAALVFDIRKVKNANNCRPYAIVRFLAIHPSDIISGSTQLNDSHIYQCTYNLSIIYPEMYDENGTFEYEKAYLTFIKEMYGIQEDVKCIEIPLSAVCDYNALIRRAGGKKFTSIYQASYTSKENVIEIVRNLVSEQIQNKTLIIPDNSLKIFNTDNGEVFIRLSKLTHLYDNTFKAMIANGPYALNTFHNHKYGLCYKRNDNSYDILIPFIYDSISEIRFNHSIYDLPVMYYFAKLEDEEDNLYSIFVQFLDESFEESKDILPSLAKNVSRIKISKRLQYIEFTCEEKKGIIRDGEVIIRPQYTSIYGHQLIDQDINEYGYEELKRKNIFVVSTGNKKGLYLEKECILQPVYDSINVEQESGVCTFAQNHHYYIGGFQSPDFVFSYKEISEEEYFSPSIENIDEDCNLCDNWTEEERWIALTDGQYGNYPKDGINWDVLDDLQGR